MHINQIRHFLDIAETHSINQSAANLFISPQGLSRSISQLEKETGLTLFRRTSKGMALSGDGKRFLPHARKIWDDYEEYLRAVTRLSIESAQRKDDIVNLRMPALFTVTDALPLLLQRIHEEFPHIRIEASETNSLDLIDYAHQLPDEALETTIMVATVPDYRMGEYLADERFVATELCSMPIVARVAASHPLASKKSISRAELARERILCFNDPMAEEIACRLLAEYGGPDFAYKGSAGNLLDRFPEAVMVSVGSACTPTAISVPIQNTIRVHLVAITADPRPPYIERIVECIGGILG